MPQIGVDIGTYTFNALAGTITIAGVTIDDIEQFSPIVNGVRGEDIFNPARAGRFGTFATNVLTLDFDTTGHADNDELYICVNLSTGDDVVGVKNALEVRINPSTEEKQDAGNALLTTISGLDFATQTTLAAVLAKIITAPSTEVKQDIAISGLAAILAELDKKADLTETQPVSAASLPLPAGASTEATLASVLAKIIAAPSTEAKQDAANALLTTISGLNFATESTLAAIKAKFIKDSVDTLVKLDTATPANNEPLPTNIYNENGERATATNPIEIQRSGIISTYSTVASNTLSVLLIAANTERVSVTITNTDTKRLWLKNANPATADTPKFLDKDDVWIIREWKGAIYGIWATGAATGSALIEEVDN